MSEYNLRDIPSPSRCNLQCSCLLTRLKAKHGQRILRLRINPHWIGDDYQFNMCFDCFVKDTKEPQPLGWDTGSCHICHKGLVDGDVCYRVGYFSKTVGFCVSTLCPDCRNQLLMPVPMTPEEALILINNPSEYLRAAAIKILGG